MGRLDIQHAGRFVGSLSSVAFLAGRRVLGDNWKLASNPHGSVLFDPSRRGTLELGMVPCDLHNGSRSYIRRAGVDDGSFSEAGATDGEKRGRTPTNLKNQGDRARRGCWTHPPRRRQSAIGLFAIADVDNFDGIAATFTEDDTPVADPEPIARRIEAVKLLDISRVGFQKSGETLE
jgi:hypothetical protein